MCARCGGMEAHKVGCGVMFYRLPPGCIYICTEQRGLRVVMTIAKEVVALCAQCLYLLFASQGMVTYARCGLKGAGRRRSYLNYTKH